MAKHGNELPKLPLIVGDYSKADPEAFGPDIEEQKRINRLPVDELAKAALFGAGTGRHKASEKDNKYGQLSGRTGRHSSVRTVPSHVDSTQESAINEQESATANQEKPLGPVAQAHFDKISRAMAEARDNLVASGGHYDTPPMIGQQTIIEYFNSIDSSSVSPDDSRELSLRVWRMSELLESIQEELLSDEEQ